MTVALDHGKEGSTNSVSKTGGSSGGEFTLRRLYVWVQEPLQRLTYMAMMVDAARGLKGGALVSALACHLRHGDPFVQSFVRRMMLQVKPSVLPIVHSFHDCVCSLTSSIWFLFTRMQK
jgi:hypothetical protein